MDDFTIEVKRMTDDDLENSINMLKDAYTKEEYEIIKNEYSLRKGKNPDNEPVIIYCRKCDSANEYGNKLCKYCNESLDKFYSKDDLEMQQNERGVTGYLIGIVLPLIGIIMGLIYIARKEDKYGMKLIVISILASVLYSVILIMLMQVF